MKGPLIFGLQEVVPRVNDPVMTQAVHCKVGTIVSGYVSIGNWLAVQCFWGIGVFTFKDYRAVTTG